MLFYKIGYRVIAFLVMLIGIILIPFLPLIVGKVTIAENITYIYVLFLMDIVASYLLSYKRSILYANQKTYVVNLIHMICFIVMNVLQLAILTTTKNYIFYLWMGIMTFLLNSVFLIGYLEKDRAIRRKI